MSAMVLGRSLAQHRQEMRRFGRRFWLRNLGSVPRDGLRPVRLPNMEPIYIRPGESDLDVLHQIYFAKFYQIRVPEVRERIDRRYREILAAGKVPIIVDAGANIGISSIWFARQYGDARVVAVEPDAGNLALLRRNVAPYPNVAVLDAAIGATRGFAALSNSGERLAWTVQTSRAEDGVKIVTVDDAFAASGGDEPFIVKIDIEGFERDLFASNLDWLDRAYVVFVEPHDWMFPGERSSGPVQQAMAQRSFEMFIAGDTLAFVRI
jgi:FkbM family methyltransferase